MNSKYQEILNFVKRSKRPTKHKVTTYAEISNELKANFPKISWVGVYEKDLDRDELYLSAYVGDLACEKIPVNNGVCGKCFRENKTQLVEDVTILPYHIACSSETRSEVVAPIRENGVCVAVLDIDSKEYSAFNDEDVKALEEIVREI